MMPGTADCEADTGPEPGWGALRRLSDELVTRYAATVEAVAGGSAGPDRARQMVNLTAAYRQHCAELARVTLTAAYVAEAEARAYERGLADGRAAARVPGQRSACHAQRAFVPCLVQESQGNGYGAPASSPLTASRA